MRKDQNMFSVEDVKKDFVKVQDQANYLEEKIVTLQKLTESTAHCPGWEYLMSPWELYLWTDSGKSQLYLRYDILI